MAKTLELVFELAGKIASSFTGATGKAAAELGKVAAQTKAISAAAQARADEKAFKNLHQAAGNVGKAFGHLRSEITGTLLSVAAPAAAAGAAIYGVATTSANYADQAIKNAQSVGMSTAAFTEMAYAAKMAGVSQQDFVSGSAKLSKSVEAALGGNQQMIDSFARAGISSEELAASLGEPGKLYAKLADTFASMPDGIGKTSLSMALLGKSGSKFIPFLNAGSAAMDQLREDARRLGISLSETDAKNAEAFNDSFANIGEAMRGVSLIIGKNLWPHLTKVHEAVSGWISTNGQLLAQNLPGWIERLTPVVAELKTEFYAAWEEVKAGAIVVNNMVQGMGGWIPLVKRLVQAWLVYRGMRIGKSLYDTGAAVLNLKSKFVDAIPAMARWVAAKKSAVIGSSVIKGLTSFGSSIAAAVTPALTALVPAFSAAATAAYGFAAAILANPITWVVAGIVAVGAAIYLCIKYWDDIVAAMSAAWEWIKSVFVAGWDMLPGWIQKPIANIAGAIAEFGAKIWSGIKKDWERVSAFFEPLFSGISAIFTVSWEYIANIVSTCTGAVSKSLDTALGWWGQLFDTAWGTIRGVFEAGWSLIPDWVGKPIQEAVQVISGFGSSIWSGIVEIWNRVGGALLEKFSSIGDAFENSFVGGIIEIIKQFNPITLFSNALNGLVQFIVDFDIISAATNLMTRFGEGLLAAWNSMKSGIASAVTSWIPGGETLVNMASSGASMISSGAGAVADAASGAIDYLAGLSPFADGGVVTSPRAALVGEAGPEVIIPVSRPNRARELMDTAAGMMGMGGGGSGVQYTITFSPKISISGGGESVAEQVRQSLFKAEEDFRRMMQKVLHENSRMAMR